MNAPLPTSVRFDIQGLISAIAHSHASDALRCQFTTQQWEVRALTQDNEIFEEGPATAVAAARSGVHGKGTDAHQWLVSVTLVGE